METLIEFTPIERASIEIGLAQANTGNAASETPDCTIERLVALWLGDVVLREALPPPADSVVPCYRSTPSIAHERSPERTPWYVALTDEFIKAIRSIDRKLQGRILEAISYLSQTPMSPQGDTIKPLTGDLKGLWRYRLGDYRLVYRPDADTRSVALITFTSRGEAYQ